MVYKRNMLPQERTSPGVVAAAIVAIAGSVLTIAFGILVQVSTRIGPGARRGNLPPEAAQTLVYGRIVWLFIIALAVFGVLTGVELMNRKNWARITILVWSGLKVGFSLLAMLATFAVFRAMPAPPNMPASQFRAMVLIVPLFYLVPLGIGIWWLVFFTRKSVAAQFTGQAVAPWQPGMPPEANYYAAGVAPSTIEPAKPSCPLPVAIIAGVMIFSGVSTLLTLLIPARVPTLLLGHAIWGVPERIFLAAFAAAHLAAAIGMFRLKPWSYYLGVGVQIFSVASALVNLISPNIEEVMRQAMSQLALPHGAPQIFDPVRYIYWILILGALFGGVLLAVLLNYRARFMEAAEQAAEAKAAV